jgi:hypothetical protein
LNFPYWLWRYPSLGKKKYQSWSARSSFLSSKPRFSVKVRRNSMQSYNLAMAAMALTCAGLTASAPAMALDIGGRDGVSVGGNGSGGISASIGGSSGVNAGVGGRSSGGLAVDASVGGSSGVNSNTTVGGGSGLGAGISASVGGSSGVNANVGARVGGSRLATATTNARLGGVDGATADVNTQAGGSRLGTARATVGAGGTTLADILLGGTSEDGGNGVATPGTDSNGVGQSNIGAANARAALAIDDMSSTERAKAKLRCKDILRSGSYDASLTKLCKMVVSMN